jgi:MFS superfamily sulfate permease-like transporter
MESIKLFASINRKCHSYTYIYNQIKNFKIVISNFFSTAKADLGSGLVVFLVALPLCLGIALASGAPPLAGIISGVIGGIVVGLLSNSQLSVSGPAAGLTAVVLTAINDLGGFDVFLVAVFLGGLMQLVLGFIKAGTISNYFPSNVIEGMLAGIGVIIILKQLPHAVGFDRDFEGDEAFLQDDGLNSFSEIWALTNHFELGAVIVTFFSLVILISWNKIAFLKKIKFVPGALVAVLLGILLNELFAIYFPNLVIGKQHLVNLPVPRSLQEFSAFFVFPNFAEIANPKVWIVAGTIAVVASIETLLCIEAADQLDKKKRYTDTNLELKAQGIGNMFSALLGGLPMTSVVVRTSANSSAGAKSKLSTIIHGFFLLISVVAIPTLLNKIPLATLAAILLMVGYKLAKPATFIHFWQHGKYQFIPFIATLLAVVLTDLLKGVFLGILISIVFVLKGNLQRAYRFNSSTYNEGDIIHIDLAEEVSFLNKAAIKSTLNKIPVNSKVVIDATNTVYIAHDILELIKEFKITRADTSNIKVKLRGFKSSYNLENETENQVKFETHYDAMKRVVTKKEIF